MTLLEQLPSRPRPVADLCNGDRMSRKEFHRAYATAPDGFKAELIGGTVHVSPPLQLRHGRNHLPLGAIFFLYEGSTPGVEAGDNTTILLGDDSEPQPDLFLRILPDFGGQSSTTKDDFVRGAPELIAEISSSSRAIDLHAKRADYEKHGVLEYLVVSLKEKKLRWFDLAAPRELSADTHGVLRIRAFPGLWIHGPALLDRDVAKLTATLQQGLDSPQHTQFVKQLAARGGRKAKG
jgi:Uma2 family endonuclease